MIAAVSLPNESEEENTPKKEVTHHLPPGAYPVYPQFMGMYVKFMYLHNINSILSNYFKEYKLILVKIWFLIFYLIIFLILIRKFKNYRFLKL